MLYRKKPVLIEAVKWTGENVKEMMEFIGIPHISYEMPSGKLSVVTLEGVMTAKKGDFIIKGVQGEFYPCKPGIFAETYEIAE
ncbi:hypothetical protein ACSBRS_010610 [Streptococcus suis]|uniref:hypothetical protein n=1 Tax=Streptococcus suis TaxID=1307 RepID=UPI002AADF13F|nr:hypothetical protein [Streptococcus suis]